MGNWINWALITAGIVCVIVELSLGAFTGFDLALVGASLTLGGVLGAVLKSGNGGLLAAAGLALLYLAVFRSWLKSRLTVKDEPTNVDAVVGKTGVVTKRIASLEAGLVKVGTEIWRAELAYADGPARDTGVTVTVQAVEGVTLKVR